MTQTSRRLQELGNEQNNKQVYCKEISNVALLTTPHSYTHIYIYIYIQKQNKNLS